MVALTIVPLIGFVGAAVDYTRANAARTALQASLDSTALLLAKTAPNQTSAELQTSDTNGFNAFNALFHRPDVQNVQVTAYYSSTAGSKVTLRGSGTYRPPRPRPTRFAQDGAAVAVTLPIVPAPLQ